VIAKCSFFYIGGIVDHHCGDPVPGLEQAEKCGGLNLLNGS
jgi:hypothetical protein